MKIGKSQLLENVPPYQVEYGTRIILFQVLKLNSLKFNYIYITQDADIPSKDNIFMIMPENVTTITVMEYYYREYSLLHLTVHEVSQYSLFRESSYSCNHTNSFIKP